MDFLSESFYDGGSCSQLKLQYYILTVKVLIFEEKKSLEC